jgi:hypothetical protein
LEEFRSIIKGSDINSEAPLAELQRARIYNGFIIVPKTILFFFDWRSWRSYAGVTTLV